MTSIYTCSLLLRVLSSFEDEGEGTLITFEEDKMEQATISGIAFSRDEAKITVLGVPDRPGMARSDLLRPDVMGPAVAWFASDEADGITAKRIDAKLWDEKLSGKQNADKACKPIGWGPLGA